MFVTTLSPQLGYELTETTAQIDYTLKLEYFTVSILYIWSDNLDARKEDSYNMIKTCVLAG